MPAPPGLGGPEPGLSLSYSSSNIDGRVASTNNQPSWAGEGFDLDSGYVERKYVPCSLDTKDGNNATHATGDLCWRSDNATLVFAGGAGELVQDKTTGIWRFKNDDGSKIERLTGAANGDNDGEYWKLTTNDGVQYFFGLNKRSPADTQQTQSAWTVPVFGNHPDEPCRAASFAASSCGQAWRWNLDYVVDLDGNTLTYTYTPEHNRYGKDLNTASVDYIRGGYLSRVDYGTRKGSEHTSPAPARVVFTDAERCLPSGSITCEPAQLTAANAASWPDVPFDQICASTTTCPTNTSPTFFTTKRLATVTTQIRSGSGYADVDAWTLTHSFPNPGDGSKPGLWLDSIQHTGKNGSALSLPKLIFDGVPRTNRVDVVSGKTSMTKWRISSIASETGGLLSVNYASPDCEAGAAKPAEDNNTKRCFPVFWDANGDGTLAKDWFHKYVVSSVVQEDRTAGGLQEPTTYTYLGEPAWHYDDDPMTPIEQRTWAQWRGYGKVRVTEGQSGKTQTITDYTYFRGMDDDRLGDGGKRDAKVTNSEGVALDDHWRYNGFEREQVTYSGTDVAQGEINTPWLSPTTAEDSIGRTAHLLEVADNQERTALDGGRGWRTTRRAASFDAHGMPTQVNDLGDLAVAGDERCTRYTYARNIDAWLLDLESRQEVVAKACDQPVNRPTEVLSDELSAYDNGSVGAAPIRGNITASQSLSGWANGAPTYTTDGRSRYDDNGRLIETLDAADAKTTTAFTPATGGPVTSMTTTNALGHTTTTMLDPARGQAVSVTDANSKQSTAEYDALGRLIKVWAPERPKAANPVPSIEYGYLVRNDAPSAVTTKTLGPDGGQVISTQLMDTLFRPRQTQTQATGSGRVLTDTLYDDRGLIQRQTAPYYNNDSGPTTTLLAVPDFQVPSQTVTSYDSLGRPTASAYQIKGVEQWRTTASYGGDRTSIDPPAGTIATTTITDADGQTTELRQYKGDNPSGAFDATTYGYDADDNLARVTDSVGNTWRYTYDLRGRKIKEEDPDTGTSTTSYDALDRQVTATDSRGKTIATVYDALGRLVSRHDGTVNGTKLTEWSYDTLAKGLPTSSTRYVDGQAYTFAVAGYDDAYSSTGTNVTIPATEGALAGTYTFGSTYNVDGSLATESLPAKGNLPAETLKHGYDNLGQATTLTGLRSYVLASTYAPTGETLQYSLALSDQHKKTWQTFTYEEGTNRPKTALLTREGISGSDTDLRYRYDDAGNVLSITDTPTAPATSPETQCFGYDYLRRLTEAWTQNGTCAQAPSPQTIAGPAPYWHSYTYDPTGNRTKEVQHDTSGGTADTARTYTYPKPGTAQPHTLSQVDTAGPQGSQSDTYTYDQAGNTTSRLVGTKTQTLTWDSEGSLTQISEGSTTTSYLYDADGDRLIRREPNTTTLYLPSGMELALDKSANTIKGTRYYSHNGDTIAVRQGGTVQYLMDDHQGTAEIAINGTTYATTTRRTTPFGAPRGTNPVSWPGQRGFVGGANDPTTGLVRLGAREYDPSTGRFITVDPIIDKDVPQQMNGYAYADNSPVTFSDPTGLCATCSGVDGTVVHPKTKKRIKGNTSSNPKYANSGVPTRKKVVLNSHHTKKSRALAKHNQAKMKRERRADTRRRASVERQKRYWKEETKAERRAQARKNRKYWEDLLGNFLTDASAGMAIGAATRGRGRIGPAPKFDRNLYTRMTPGVRKDAIEKAPTCVYCGKKPSTQADHISSVKDDWTSGGWDDDKPTRSGRVNDPDNLIGACQPCNGSKGAKEIGSGTGQWWPSGWKAGEEWPYGGPQ